MAIFFVILGIFSSCTLENQKHILPQLINSHAIYGDQDQRIEVTAVGNSQYHTWVQAVAAQIHLDHLNLRGDVYDLYAPRLGGKELSDGKKVCSDIRFGEQITAANCSGFLVAEDLLLTAGHCVTNQKDCDYFVWAFDYENSEHVAATEVYRCVEIINHKNTDDKPRYDEYEYTFLFGSGAPPQGVDPQEIIEGEDFAIIRLDRIVTNREPLKVRLEGKLSSSASLIAIGHPQGLPKKIVTGGRVLSNKAKNSFHTNLDLFHGNSGSPIIDEDLGIVEGIVVRGKTDYIFDYAKKCYRELSFSDGYGGGEKATRITIVK